MRDKNTINRATFERCAKGFVIHVDCGAGLLSETYAFNYACEAADWLNNQFTDEEDQGPQCPEPDWTEVFNKHPDKFTTHHPHGG